MEALVTHVDAAAAGVSAATLHLASSGGGDSGDPHIYPYAPIFFVFFTLAVGAALSQVLERFAPQLPYTVVLLLVGILFGFAREGLAETHIFELHPLLESSFLAWTNIDPHLLLYLFLPALLFGDSMTLNFHMIKKCLVQCLILAGPGVLIGGALMAFVAKALFVSWDWASCLMFGSVLAATDPVAVVGILKAFGVRPKLTMIISGESLMNDGVAIVMYLFFRSIALNSNPKLREYHSASLVGVPDASQLWPLLTYGGQFFVQVALGGIVWGFFMGIVAVIWIRSASSRTSHSDQLVQVTITFCCAYLTFFIGEGVLHVSGVLATVVAAVVVGVLGWTHFQSRAMMGKTWHFVEYLFNTLLFFLSGMLMGARVWQHRGSRALDLNAMLALCVLYISALLVRGLIIFGFFPALRRLSYGLSKKEGIVLAWGGLRGAVGLALAIDIDHFWNAPCTDAPADDAECRELREFAATSFFQIGGFAVMTLLINGTTTGPLLKFLGMMKSDEDSEALLSSVQGAINLACQDKFEKAAVKLYGKGLTTPQKDQVIEYCSVLKHNTPNATREAQRRRKLVRDLSTNSTPSVAVQLLFWRMLKNEYLAQSDIGILPEELGTLLTESVDSCIARLSTNQEQMSDLNFVTRLLSTNERMTRWARLIGGFLPASWGYRDIVITVNWTVRHEGQMESLRCWAFICFIEAHMFAQKKILRLLICPTETKDTAHLIHEAAIITKSKAMVAKATVKLKEHRSEMISTVKVRQVTRMVLEEQQRLIESYQEIGMVDMTQAHHLMEELEHDMEKVDHFRLLPAPTRESMETKDTPQPVGLVGLSALVMRERSAEQEEKEEEKEEEEEEPQPQAVEAVSAAFQTSVGDFNEMEMVFTNTTRTEHFFPMPEPGRRKTLNVEHGSAVKKGRSAPPGQGDAKKLLHEGEAPMSLIASQQESVASSVFADGRPSVFASFGKEVKCSCGNTLMADAEFCRKCGTKRSEEQDATSTMQAESSFPLLSGVHIPTEKRKGHKTVTVDATPMSTIQESRSLGSAGLSYASLAAAGETFMDQAPTDKKQIRHSTCSGP